MVEIKTGNFFDKILCIPSKNFPKNLLVIQKDELKKSLFIFSFMKMFEDKTGENIEFECLSSWKFITKKYAFSSTCISDRTQERLKIHQE